MYKEQINTATGEKRWIKVDDKELSMGDKLKEIPLIGNTLSNLSSIAGAKTIKDNLGSINKQAETIQKKSRELAIAARSEMNPETKKKMLDESRNLSQKASDLVNNFTGKTTNMIATFGDNKTKGYEGARALTDINSYKNYGPAALRSAVEVGTLAAPATSGITKVATKPVSQILSATLAGATTGGVSGFAEGENLSTKERLLKAKDSAIIGGVLSGTLASAGQLVKSGKDLVKGLSKTEKERGYLEMVNPQIKTGDANYRDKYNKIIDYTKKYKAKNANDLLNQLSDKRIVNQKEVATIFNKSTKKIDAKNLGVSLSDKLKNLEVDTRNPSVKTAIRNIGTQIDKKVTYSVNEGIESNVIKPKELYKLVDTFGNKAGFDKLEPNDAELIYREAYTMLKKTLNGVSKEARGKISENDIIRKTLPGLIKTSNTKIKQGMVDKLRKIISTTGMGISTVAGTKYLLSGLTDKEK